MSVVLLDTNIVSYSLKGDSRMLAYAPYLDDKSFAISFMTAAELYEWAAIHKWGWRRLNQLAVHYNLPLVTHNPKDFQHIQGLDVITVDTS